MRKGSRDIYDAKAGPVGKGSWDIYNAKSLQGVRAQDPADSQQKGGRAREMTQSVMHLSFKREDLSSDPGCTCKISVER